MASVVQILTLFFVIFLRCLVIAIPVLVEVFISGKKKLQLIGLISLWREFVFAREFQDLLL